MYELTLKGSPFFKDGLKMNLETKPTDDEIKTHMDRFMFTSFTLETIKER